MGKANTDFCRREMQRLAKRLAAVEADLDTAQTTEQRRALKQQAHQITEEMDELHSDTEEDLFSWDEHIHKIDHEKAKRVTNGVVREIQRKGNGASLLLFQNYDDFLGNRYIEHLKQSIYSSDIGCFSKHRQIGGFRSQPNENDFLEALGEELAVECVSSEDISIDSVLDKIKLSLKLKGGNVFFMEVNLPDLEGESDFISWFIQKFWRRLLDRMPEFLLQNSASVFIVVVTLKTSLEDDCLKKHSSKPSNLPTEKFVVMPEDRWREDKVREWLEKFSRVPLSEDRERIFKYIWRSKKESPSSMEWKLLRELENYVSSIR